MPQGALAFKIKQTIIRIQERLPSKKYWQVRSMSLGTCQQEGRKKAYVTKQEESRERVVGGKGIISIICFPTHQDKDIWFNDLDSTDDSVPLDRGNPIILSPHYPPPSMQTFRSQKLLVTFIPPIKFLLELSTQHTAEAASKSVYWETSLLKTLHYKEMQRVELNILEDAVQKYYAFLKPITFQQCFFLNF